MGALLEDGKADLRTAAVRREWSTHAGPPKDAKPFVFGNILFANKVLTDDTFNPQWNNPRFLNDLGLTQYPPYAEASGYALSASLAHFLAHAARSSGLSWKSGWAVEDTTFGVVLAG